MRSNDFLSSGNNELKIRGGPAGPQPAHVSGWGSAHFLANPLFQSVLHLLCADHSFEGQTGITRKRPSPWKRSPPGFCLCAVPLLRTNSARWDYDKLPGLFENNDERRVCNQVVFFLFFFSLRTNISSQTCLVEQATGRTKVGVSFSSLNNPTEPSLKEFLHQEGG